MAGLGEGKRIPAVSPPDSIFSTAVQDSDQNQFSFRNIKGKKERNNL